MVEYIYQTTQLGHQDRVGSVCRVVAVNMQTAAERNRLIEFSDGLRIWAAREELQAATSSD